MGKRNDKKFTPGQTLAIIWGTLKAALLIAGAFGLGFGLLIWLLCRLGN